MFTALRGKIKTNDKPTTMKNTLSPVEFQSFRLYKTSNVGVEVRGEFYTM